MTGSELRCESVSLSYDEVEVLSGVDLAVPAGTLTAVLGPSGSGKTSLLRVIAGFEVAGAGRVICGGRLLAGPGLFVPPEKRGIGYMAQEGALFPHLTVGENVGFGLERGERRSGTRIGELLEMVGLPASFVGRRPQELSGGEQKRVALARALAPRPQVVVLDEPFSGLDTGLRGETRAAVATALIESSTTSVLVTHDQAEAMSMGSQVGVLRKGRLVQTAPPETIYRDPLDLQVAKAVGEAVVLPGEAHGDVVHCMLGDLPVRRSAKTEERPLKGPVEVMLRPEQLRLSPRTGTEAMTATTDATSPTADATRATGGATMATVVSREFFGHYSTVFLEIDGGALFARVPDADGIDPGRLVTVEVVGSASAFPVNNGRRGDQDEADPAAAESTRPTA